MIFPAINASFTSIGKDLKESLVSMLFCTFGDLLTGITIGVLTDSIEALPALIILIPPAIGMRGNIFASLASRLGTYLHTGEIDVGKRSRLLNENIYSSFSLTMSMSIFLGMVAWVIANHLGMKVSIITLSLISIVAGVLSAFIMLFFTFLIAFESFKRGWDPDNITSPLITLAGDVITLPLLFLSMEIVMELNGEEQLFLFLFFIVASVVITLYPIKGKTYLRIMLESSPIFIVCGLLSSFSGQILGSGLDAIMAATGILTMVPAFLEDGGAIGSILAAKFSSMLHVGSIKPSFKPSRSILKLFLMMHLIGIIIFPLIGIFAYSISLLLHLSSYSIFEMMLISFIAGEILIFIANNIAYYLSVISFKIGVNPDNVVIPLLTSAMDFVGTASLIGVVYLLGFG